MTIEDIGFDKFFQNIISLNKDSSLIPARVIRMNKRYYTLFSDEGEFLARIKGKIRHKSYVQSELPVVGDWVLMKKSDNNAFIDHVLTRKNVLYRKSSTKKTDIQAIVSNIDYAFILVAIDNEIPISAIGRYLSVVHTSNIKPVIAVSKIDLYEDIEYRKLLTSIKKSFPSETAFAYSAKTGENCHKFLDFIVKYTSSVFIGSSGAGKSTIINYLLKKEKMKTRDVREYDYKGMHTTTHRELLVSDSGGVVIDTPGLRALGLWDDDRGIKKTFEDLEEMSKNCKFNNCTHQHEPGCYILELLSEDKLSYERYSAYITLINETKDLKKNALEIGKDKKSAIKKVTKTIISGK